MLNDKVIRTSFIISLAGHIFLLSMPEFNLPAIQDKKPEEITVKIEIEKPPLLPKIDIMGEEKKLKEIEEKPKEPESKPTSEPQPEEIVMKEPEQPEPQDEPEPQPEEEVKVIDPAEEAMLRYQDMVKQRIEEVRRYPLWAKRHGIEGVVHLSFIVLSNGISQDIRIVRSSGSKILDDEAVDTIKRANPFPPIPKEISNHSVQMEVSIVFTLL